MAKVNQIVTAGDNLLGLGEDGNIYAWDFGTAKWVIAKIKNDTQKTD